MPKARVLYIDEQEDLLNQVKANLELSGGLQVDIVRSMKLAEERLLSERYDVIISDHRMPEINGIELLKKIRSQGNKNPFILFTGNNCDDVIIEALKGGVDFYLQKGGSIKIKLAELEHRVKEAIGRFKLERELEEKISTLAKFEKIYQMETWVYHVDTGWYEITYENLRDYGRDPTQKIKMEESRKLVHPDDLDIFDKFQATINEGQTGEFDYRVIFQNGLLLYVHVIIDKIVRGPDGLIESASGYTIDVTERVMAEKEAKENDEKFRQLANSSPVAVLIFQGGQWVFANPAAIAMLEYPEEELLSMNLTDISHPDSLELVRGLVRARNAGNKERTRFEAKVVTKGGNVRWTDVSVGAMYFKGAIAGLTIAVDITEKKQMENALKSANRQLNLLNEVSRHDMRNQLSILSGYTHLLKDSLEKSNDQENREMFSRLERSISSLNAQLEFMKQYGDVGAKSPEWQNLHALINRASDLLILGDLKIIENGTNLSILADPMFEKVVFNMIENVLRHGSGAKQLKIHTELNNDRMTIIFEDDGVGIDEKDRPRLFERGYGKNTGLGLFMSREILGITGMSIVEASTNGMGARFEIAVPSTNYRFFDRINE